MQVVFNAFTCWRCLNSVPEKRSLVPGNKELGIVTIWVLKIEFSLY